MDDGSGRRCQRWSLEGLLDLQAPAGTSSNEGDTIVIVLNVPILNRARFLRLCSKARLRICADGGANRVRELKLSSMEEEHCHLDLICGDMDSARPDVIEYYKGRGADIVQIDDQDTTDLMKAMDQARHRAASFESSNPTILIVGGLEGRADQALSQLHQLYRVSKNAEVDAASVFLVTAESVIFVMQTGMNHVRVPICPAGFTRNAGIVPLAGPAIVSTKGFEWNLHENELCFGDFISTSNHIIDEDVEVVTSQPVIFTLEFDQDS